MVFYCSVYINYNEMHLLMYKSGYKLILNSFCLEQLASVSCKAEIRPGEGNLRREPQRYSGPSFMSSFTSWGLPPSSLRELTYTRAEHCYEVRT